MALNSKKKSRFVAGSVQRAYTNTNIFFLFLHCTLGRNMDLLRMVKAILRILRLLVCFEGMYRDGIIFTHHLWKIVIFGPIESYKNLFRWARRVRGVRSYSPRDHSTYI